MENKLAIRNDYSLNLTKEEQEIVIATNSVKLINAQTANRIEQLVNLLRLTHFNTGFALKGSTPEKQTEHLIYTAQALYEVIAYKYERYTIEDVKIAFKNGVLGEYGEFQGLAVATFAKWLKGYESARKDATFKQYKQLEKTQEIKLTEREIWLKEKEVRKHCFSEFNKFKAGVKYNKIGDAFYPAACPDAGNVIYNYLDSKGIIPFTTKRKNEFMLMAEKLIREENNPKTKFNQIDRLEAKYLIAQIENGSKSAYENIVIRAKKLALNEYFKLRIEIKNI